MVFKKSFPLAAFLALSASNTDAVKLNSKNGFLQKMVESLETFDPTDESMLGVMDPLGGGLDVQADFLAPMLSAMEAQEAETQEATRQANLEKFRSLAHRNGKSVANMRELVNDALKNIETAYKNENAVSSQDIGENHVRLVNGVLPVVFNFSGDGFTISLPGLKECEVNELLESSPKTAQFASMLNGGLMGTSTNIKEMMDSMFRGGALMNPMLSDSKSTPMIEELDGEADEEATATEDAPREALVELLLNQGSTMVETKNGSNIWVNGAAYAVATDLIAQATQFLEDKDVSDLELTLNGHSFGGQVALVARLLLAEKQGMERIAANTTVFAFGSPPVGDENALQALGEMPNTNVILDSKDFIADAVTLANRMDEAGNMVEENAILLFNDLNQHNLGHESIDEVDSLAAPSASAPIMDVSWPYPVTRHQGHVTAAWPEELQKFESAPENALTAHSVRSYKALFARMDKEPVMGDGEHTPCVCDHAGCARQGGLSAAPAVSAVGA